MFGLETTNNFENILLNRLRFVMIVAVDEIGGSSSGISILEQGRIIDDPSIVALKLFRSVDSAPQLSDIFAVPVFFELLDITASSLCRRSQGGGEFLGFKPRRILQSEARRIN